MELLIIIVAWVIVHGELANSRDKAYVAVAAFAAIAIISVF